MKYIKMVIMPAGSVDFQYTDWQEIIHINAVLLNGRISERGI